MNRIGPVEMARIYRIRLGVKTAINTVDSILRNCDPDGDTAIYWYEVIRELELYQTQERLH